MRTEIQAFTNHLRDRRSPRTVKTYAAAVAAFFATEQAGPDQPSTARDVETFLARPLRDGSRRSASTRNQELAALRAFSAFAIRELGWSTRPTDGIPFVREAPKDPPVLSVFELRRLFVEASNITRGSERSRALATLALLSQLGLRVHELVALDLGQVDASSATLLSVMGKGKTCHDLPLNPQTIAFLQAWLSDRSGIAKPAEQALFVSSRGTRLSVRSVEHLIAGLRSRMGTAKHITPHTLRHSAATLALTLGTDLATVGELLRHSDLNTTRRYLHLIDERRREAVRRLAIAIPPDLVPVPPEHGAVPQACENDENQLDVQHGLAAMSTQGCPIATAPSGPPRDGPMHTTGMGTTRALQGAFSVGRANEADPTAQPDADGPPKAVECSATKDFGRGVPPDRNDTRRRDAGRATCARVEGSGDGEKMLDADRVEPPTEGAGQAPSCQPVAFPPLATSYWASPMNHWVSLILPGGVFMRVSVVLGLLLTCFLAGCGGGYKRAKLPETVPAVDVKLASLTVPAVAQQFAGKRIRTHVQFGDMGVTNINIAINDYDPKDWMRPTFWVAELDQSGAVMCPGKGNRGPRFVVPVRYAQDLTSAEKLDVFEVVGILQGDPNAMLGTSDMDLEVESLKKLGTCKTLGPIPK